MSAMEKHAPFFDQDHAPLRAFYPDAPARLRHLLAGHEAFALGALGNLAARLPETALEWNSGDLGIEQDPTTTPGNGLSAEETVRRIETCDSWIVMKNVEQDARYGALLRAALEEIEPTVRPATGPIHAPQGYIFVSSRGAVTPFHMDPEHNILMQIAGVKTMAVYDRAILDDIAPEHHEGFHTGLGHRNLPFDPGFEAHAQTVTLEPGAAIYVPVKAPHRVTNGPGVSISFSITWRSRRSVREADLHRANHLIRQRGGNPPRAGERPARDAAAVLALRASEKILRASEKISRSRR